MKLHLPLSLRSSLLACMAFVGFTIASAGAADSEPKTDLGDVMFVGDSITHGFQGKGSWRWSFAKILIDNNIYFNEVGVNSGSHGTNFGTNKVYGNGVFQNVHSAVSGERAFEISGRETAPNDRLEGSNIRQWLNLDSDYTGNRHIGADVTPSTYFLLIGTNDLLSATGDHVSEGTKYQDVKADLLEGRGGNKADMDVIIDAMREKSGKDVDIVVLTVPTWNGAFGANTQNWPNDYKCVQQFNVALEEWAKGKGVKLVDINFGLVDVANTTEPWRAVPSMIDDKLHPGPQGELIIAGNVARALGYAGRTAGQQRKAAADFSQHVGAQQIAAGQTFTQSWSGTVERGFTVDFTLGKGGVGNGSEGGWNTTNNFSVSIGDGSHFGTLNINEAYILWGNTKLFSMDASTLTGSLRIAYVYGNSARNLPSGFYVWMNDQLIGEGLGELDNGTDAVNGLKIDNNTEGDVSLENLDLDYENSWAPSTTGVKNGNPSIGGLTSTSDYGTFPGKKDWIGADELLSTDIALTGNLINVHASLGGKKGGTVVSTASGTSQIYINSDDTEGDLYLTLSGATEFQAGGGFLAFHGARPASPIRTVFNGNGYLRVINLSKETSFGNFIGTANTRGDNSVVGNLYFEFSSALATIPTHNYGTVSVAIGGVYSAPGGITGTFQVVVNDGAIGNIIGGSFNGDSRVGAVKLFLNGGFFTGNIAAGGYFGSVGDRSITISGDAVSFSVLSKLITAGAVPAGSNLFGTAAPTGTVTGSATVTLADMTAEAAFRQWKGTLSGGQSTDGTRTLVFAGVKMEGLSVTLENFDVLKVESSEYTGAASDVGLSDFGGATEIQVAEGSRLTLLAAAEGEVVYGDGLAVKNDGVIVLQKGVTLRMNTEYRAQNVSTWVVDGGKLAMGEDVEGKHDVTLTDGATLSVNGGRGEYTVTAADAGNKVIVGENTGADFNLTMGADSAVTVGAGASGNYTISYTGGGYNSLDSRDAGISGVVVLGGGGEYDMKGGMAADLKLTLPEVASERRVVNMGSGDVMLSGENYIRLSSSMKEQDGAALDTKGQLLLDKGATLHINVNDIADEVQQQGEVAYYLTNGDLSSFRAAGTAEKIVFDAAATVLGWKITYREDGAIRFASSDSNIYQSSTDNEGAGWGSTNGRSVYETVPAHKAILLDKQTTLDLSNEEAPDGVESLVMHNLIGSSGSSLTVKDDARKSKLTISNSISENDKALFKDKFDMTVEDSLTFDGNITLINVGLEVKHENPDKQVEGVPEGAPESRFIVGGDLVMLGNREVELTCGVLELHGTGNNLGGGGVVFNGAMGQLVIAGQQALTRVSGSVELAPDTEATEREHIVLTDGATLELCGGATVGRGIAIGGDAGGTLAVTGSATIASESKLQNVVLRVEEFGALHVGMTSPQDRALSNEPNRALAGLEGSGKLSADAADMEITVVGGDRVFGGDLSAYAGTMTINASKHSQVFSGSGLKGNSAWSLTNKDGGHLTLNLAESGNKLTMGRLDLQSDSHTSILFDLTEMSAGSGLQLTQLNIAKNAHVTVGQAEGLIALEGAVGEEVTLAAIRVSDAAASAVATTEVDWQLRNIKNDDGHVYTEYDSAAGVLYLKTRVETLNSYLDFAQNVNAKAGAELLGGISSAEIGGDLAGVDAAVARLLRGENGKKAANVAEANRIMAAAAGASVAVVGQALIGDVERQLRAIRNRTTNYSAGEGSETSVWLNAEGDYHKMDADGMLPGYKVNSWGGTVGAARSVGRSAEVGLALTAMYADLESEGPDRLKGDMDTYYLSAYAQVARGAWRHTLVATVGTANIDAKRSVNYGEGSYTTSGSTDGMSFGALYEVGYSIPLGAESAVCLQPVMNVAVRCTKLDAYTERGSSAALDVDAQKNTVVTLGFGARMQAALDSNFWNRTTYFEGRALVKVDCGDSEAKSRVAFHEAAATHATVRSAERGSVGVELGAGLTVPVGRSGEVFVDAGAELWSGYTNANAAAGYKITF